MASNATGQWQGSTQAAPTEGPEKEGQSKRGHEEVATSPAVNKEALQVSIRHSGPVRDQVVPKLH